LPSVRKKYSAKNPLSIKYLLSVTLGKGFAECKIAFTECLRHSAKNAIPVVQELLFPCVCLDGSCLKLGRSVMTHMVVFFIADLDIASRERPRRERRDPRVCLCVCRPSKTPLVDVESEEM
jgi:hypothetical protein